MSGMTDCFGHDHSTRSNEAVAAFEDATRAVAAHRPVAACLARALAADPDLASAWALRSLGSTMLARSDALQSGRLDAIEARRAVIRAGGGTASERLLVRAAVEAARGNLQYAATVLEHHLQSAPRDLIAVKLAHALRFMSGQPEAMHATSAMALRHWTSRDLGFGFLLGCHAFGLEELGRYSEAEATGKRAVELEPTDAWGLHAVSHVMEMQGRTVEGSDWLERSRPLWPCCNNFRFHMAWHLALFRLELGQVDAVLELYDEQVMPGPSDDFRDMANAVSLLARIEQMGGSVGHRWEGLREIALKRQTDTTYVFASLHYLLALVANGETSAAASLVRCLSEANCLGRGDQAKVARMVGAAMADVIGGGACPGLYASGQLVMLADRLQLLGGSNAQRDIFMRVLLMAARNAGQIATVSQILELRGALRTSDRFDRLMAGATSRVSVGYGDVRGAA